MLPDVRQDGAADGPALSHTVLVLSAARSRDAFIISCNLYSVNLGRKKTATKLRQFFTAGISRQYMLMN